MYWDTSDTNCCKSINERTFDEIAEGVYLQLDVDHDDNRALAEQLFEKEIKKDINYKRLILNSKDWGTTQTQISRLPFWRWKKRKELENYQTSLNKDSASIAERCEMIDPGVVGFSIGNLSDSLIYKYYWRKRQKALAITKKPYREVVKAKLKLLPNPITSYTFNELKEIVK